MDAILPPDTLVRITGNNRTKWQLVNQQGRVLTAQTLGGWHEVDLEAGGGVVRVQRNALEVMEYPKQVHDPTTRSQDDQPATSTESGPSADHRDAKPSPTEPDHGRVSAKLHKKMKPKHQMGKTYANLGRLDIASLTRYRRAYNLPVSKDCSRDELVFAVRRHFMKIKVHNEVDVILSSLKRLASGSPSTE